jgi:hypothetical protein
MIARAICALAPVVLVASAWAYAEETTTWRPSTVMAPLNPTIPPTLPVCQTPLPTDTETRVVFETLEIAGSPITDYRPTCTTQFQPDDDARKPTYRWECGGAADENFFSFYLRGLTEAGQALNLVRPLASNRLGYNFDTASPNLAMFFRTPVPSRMSLELVGDAQAAQNFKVANAVITEHRLLGRRGKIGELRFVRGCAEFEFDNFPNPNERGDRRPAGKIRFLFQGELEDLTLKSHAN